MDSNLLPKDSDEARRQLARQEGGESSESEEEQEGEVSPRALHSFALNSLYLGFIEAFSTVRLPDQCSRRVYVMMMSR